MGKNKVQFPKGYSLFAFIKDYVTEAQCRQALSKWRWPDGFRCPDCGSSRHTAVKTRDLYQCTKCHHQTPLTSGTISGHTKPPPAAWFLAIHLITRAKTGISALALKRQIGVSYNTAWAMKQKTMQVMNVTTATPLAAPSSWMMFTGAASATAAKGAGGRKTRHPSWRRSHWMATATPLP